MKNISVIIPSLDPDARLEGVVKSILDTGFCDVILVDDGSKNENKKFCGEAMRASAGATPLPDASQRCASRWY